MSRFTGFSEKSFLKKLELYGPSMGSDAIALNFSKELDSTDCSMQVCLEILDFKSDVIYFNKN